MSTKRPHGAGSHGAGRLRGVRVVVAGAGISGLVAARELVSRGATVDVYEARDRIGGRVHTIRGGVMGALHVEAGGEFINAEHHRVLRLAKALNLELTRVLRRGFGTAIRYEGRMHVSNSQTTGWRELGRLLENAVEIHRQHDGDWHGTVASVLARRSLADALDKAGASPRVFGFAQALRGFFVGDPSELSALVAVDQLLDGNPGAVRLSRIVGGADRLAGALAADPRFDVHCRHVVRRVAETRRSLRVTIAGPNGRRADRSADYVVLTLPPPLVLDVECSPPLPAATRRALETLSLGRGTKTLMRFDAPWWRRARRPRAFGTNLLAGAVWESAEEQTGSAALTLFAGGSASAGMQGCGTKGLLSELHWMGRPQEPTGHVQIAWENDPWARGAYAVFTPRFDPNDRELLGRACGRVLLAGEHTSRDAQGYIEGAIESGERVAAEVESLARLSRL